MSALHVSADAAHADFRSARPQQEFEQEWKRLKKKNKSLIDRLSWLNREWAVANCEAKRHGELVESIRCEMQSIRDKVHKSAPSVRWILDAADNAEFPPGGKLTAMVLSDEKTRIGENAVGTRRFTPPQCKTEEDMIDRLTSHQAIFGDGEVFPMSWPASPSAIALQRIAHYKRKMIERQRKHRAGKSERVAAAREADDRRALRAQ